MFSGYKTYIVGILAVLGSVGAYLYGELTIAQASQDILTAVLAMTVRNGIATATKI